MISKCRKESNENFEKAKASKPRNVSYVTYGPHLVIFPYICITYVIMSCTITNVELCT
jgi:hypothetical protein